MFRLKVVNQQGEEIVSEEGKEEVNLVCRHVYEPGDQIILETEEKQAFVWFQLDDALGESMIYLTGNAVFTVPFEEKRNNISPKAFYGEVHLLKVRRARGFEYEQYRNLAFSVVDHHANTAYFPHAVANVETRGESVFAAQNAIDGNTSSNSHGDWPYESWGINRQDDATLRILFGRKVKIDRVILYLRTDFPHDNWWESAKLRFSDGSVETVKLEKRAGGQEFLLEEKTVEWVQLEQMQKADDPSPFPALTQIKIYGREANI